VYVYRTYWDNLETFLNFSIFSIEITDCSNYWEQIFQKLVSEGTFINI